MNAAGYYNDWRDFQAMVTEIRSGINVIVLSNAGDARIYGGEIDIAYRPTDTINLRAWRPMPWIRRSRKFNNAAGAPDFTGNKLANAPDYSLTGILPLAGARARAAVGDLMSLPMLRIAARSTTRSPTGDRIRRTASGW